MSEPLSDHERETTLRVARVMYPHDALPDEAYENVVRAVEAEASGNEDVRATIVQAIAELDEPTPFGELEADAQLQALRDAEGTPYFDLVRATAVVALAIRQAEYITEQLRSGSIPTGHAVWDGRDPGGPAPDLGDVPPLEQPQPATN